MAEKNLSYYPLLTLDQLKRVVQASKRWDIAVQEQAIAMQLQHRTGFQLVVEKEVTDLLQDSDLPSKLQLSEIPWIQTNFEVYFEDPALPTVLCSYIAPKKAWSILGLAEKDMSFPYAQPEKPHLFGCIGQTGGLLSTIIHAEDLQSVLLGRDPYRLMMQILGEKVEPLSPIQLALQLVIKVLFYAVTEQGIQQATSRKQLHHGGKAGVKGRPKRPITRIICLPSLKQMWKENEEHSQHHVSGSRIAHPRRGFFRHYTAEKFVNMRGTVQFIPPTWVTGKASKTKPVYLVRQPTNPCSGSPVQPSGPPQPP